MIFDVSHKSGLGFQLSYLRLEKDRKVTEPLMMINSFKLEFGLTLEALVESFRRGVSGGRAGVKEPSCPVSGLDSSTCDE